MASSTRNVRIERMWVEVGTQFCIFWRVFFTRLERRHGLDPSKPEHLWLLHMLFLDDINTDCRNFQREWNKHPVSGAGHNMTPNVSARRLVSSGSLISTYIISQYYGTDGRRRRSQPGQTGAGHYDHDGSSISSDRFSSSARTAEGTDSETSDSEEDEDQEVDSQVAADQQRHVRHPPIPVPGSTSPFSEETEELFIQCLHQVRAQERVPMHLGVSPTEWPGGIYGDLETVSFGRGGRQEEFELPFSIWWRRAVEWAQGLELMTALLIEQGA
ncbi:hypothetical protein K466DRAFT_503297 [Polyporus arcularius HHB13444]|uniref:Integrase core domain-containing protein n=1 Tax=Polyporus arcularius HHB13444 TaxID=1314778 RepID=A0A5C3P4S7_9APHY|nr:hypothetical protein K466DRAFT_503297 [Polyporus arcularius HHB13444]